MNIRTILTTLAITTTVFTLPGCGDNGSQTPGVSIIAQTTHLTNSTANGELDHENEPRDQTSSIKPIYRDDNMFIELQQGLVNLRATELLACQSIAATAAYRVLNFILPTAQAHAAHIPSGPAGVIDVLKPDLLVWDLGELQPQAGSYCGLKLEISNVKGTHGNEAEHVESGAEGGTDMEAGTEDEGVSMAGKGVLVSPCYYPDTAGTPQTPADNAFPHSCIEAAYRGEAISGTVNFAAPVTLGQAQRSIHLMLATAYDNWFNDLDMTILADDASEQSKLARNVLDSFYLYSAE